MIRSFRHKGLELFFRHDNKKGIDSTRAARIKRILDALDDAETPSQMDFPGWRLHALTGNRRGTWSVNVSGNWRITFEFEGTNAINVNLEDYH